MPESISCIDLAAVTGGKVTQSEPTPPPPPGEPRLDLPGNPPEPRPQPGPMRDPWLPIAPSPLPG
jgi:hypothetical protein